MITSGSPHLPILFIIGCMLLCQQLHCVFSFSEWHLGELTYSVCAVQLCTYSTVSCWCLYSSLSFDLHRLGKSCCVKLLTYAPRGKQIARNAENRLLTDVTRCFMIHLFSFIYQLFGNVKKNKTIKYMSRFLDWYCFPGFGLRFFNNNPTHSQRQVNKTITMEWLTVDKTSFCLRGSAEECQRNAKAEYYELGVGVPVVLGEM